MRINVLILVMILAVVSSACADRQQLSYNRALEMFAQRNYPAARTALLALSNNGFAPAQFRLGLMYLHGLGISAQPQEAAHWFEKAAQQGDVGGQYSLSRLYLNGVGVNKNEVLARHWLQRLAENNYVPAQYQLALMLTRGQGGEIDLEQALYWFKSAAEQKYGKALLTLEQAYRQGALGLPIDPEQAQYWRDLGRHEIF